MVAPDSPSKALKPAAQASVAILVLLMTSDHAGHRWNGAEAALKRWRPVMNVTTARFYRHQLHIHDCQTGRTEPVVCGF
jgi:hypothetical protein